MPKDQIRLADVLDANDIYKLCCKLELTEDAEKMSKNGFLMTQYSAHPEMEDFFREITQTNPFYVCAQYEGNITGLLLGYTEEQWKKETSNTANDGNVSWNYDILKEVFGIDNPEEITSFALLEKIAVEPELKRRGIATGLLARYASDVKREGVGLVMAEIVEHIYRGNTPLKITNQASIRFFESKGFEKIGESGIYQYSDSFLGDEGRFKDGIYLANADDILRLTGRQ